MKFKIDRADKYREPPYPGATEETVMIEGLEFTHWVIDVPDLDTLMAIAEDHGIVVYPASFVGWPWPSITIYDGYIE